MSKEIFYILKKMLFKFQGNFSPFPFCFEQSKMEGVWLCPSFPRCRMVCQVQTFKPFLRPVRNRSSICLIMRNRQISYEGATNGRPHGTQPRKKRQAGPVSFPITSFQPAGRGSRSGALPRRREREERRGPPLPSSCPARSGGSGPSPERTPPAPGSGS